jgi:type II restriction enzyme
MSGDWSSDGALPIWSAFKIMDILIAVRSEGRKMVLNSEGDCIVLDRLFDSVDGVMEYLQDTGLAELFRTQKIKDLVDYVFGIETGLDTNARKNRSGDITELLLHRILTANGIEHRMEVYSHEYPVLQKALGADEKRFDFVIETKRCTYLIEVNFYNGGGSKPNEVARAYRELSPIVNKVDWFEFVWVTDGQGWNSARNKLEEAYNEIDRMYNFESLSEFIKEVQSEL